VKNNFWKKYRSNEMTIAGINPTSGIFPKIKPATESTGSTRNSIIDSAIMYGIKTIHQIILAIL
jgi:hypothetical protein